MENENQVPVEASVGAGQKRKVGKIIGIIVIVILVGLVLFVWWGFQLQKKDKELLTNFEEKTETNPELLETQAYLDSVNGFKINTPKGWVSSKEGDSRALAVFMDPVLNKEGESLAIIYIGSLNTALDLDSYANSVPKNLEKNVQDFKLIEDKQVDINGTPARILDMSFANGAGRTRINILILVKDGKAYSITGSVLLPEADPDTTWAQYKDLIEASLMTFNFTK